LTATLILQHQKLNFVAIQSRDQTWLSPLRVNLASVPLVCSFSRQSRQTPLARLADQQAQRVDRKTGSFQFQARPNGTPLHSAQFAAPFRQPSFVTPLQLDGTTEAPFQFSEPLTAHSPNRKVASVMQGWRRFGRDNKI
jgi:hypothetical protein